MARRILQRDSTRLQPIASRISIVVMSMIMIVIMKAIRIVVMIMLFVVLLHQERKLRGQKDVT